MAKEKDVKRNYVVMIVVNVPLSILLSYILTVFSVAVITSFGIDIENAKYIFMGILGCVFILLTLKSFYGINIL